MINALEILKVPVINGSVIVATTFIDGITDVLSINESRRMRIMVWLSV